MLDILQTGAPGTPLRSTLEEAGVWDNLTGRVPLVSPTPDPVVRNMAYKRQSGALQGLMPRVKGQHNCWAPWELAPPWGIYSLLFGPSGAHSSLPKDARFRSFQADSLSSPIL